VSDLDALLAEQPVEPPTLAGATGKPRKCPPHRWVLDEYWVGHEPHTLANQWKCRRCGTPKDETRSRRGKSAVQRSKREERKLAKDYAGRRTGQYGGPDDVQTELLNIQSKAGTGWWSKRYADELDKLPRTGGRVPALIVSNGKPGNLVRRFVVMDEKDYRALYGDRILDGSRP
jgi:hypothetical protein